MSEIISMAADVGTALGLLIAGVGLLYARGTYLAEREKDRLEREYGTFDDLDDKYVEFMYKCTEHPHLDLFSTPAAPDRKIDQEGVAIERALFAVLISIFERAFLIFERHADQQTRERQYPGWQACMRSYCTRESFLAEWNDIGSQFDTGFHAEMERLISEERDRSAQSQLLTTSVAQGTSLCASPRLEAEPAVETA